MGCGPPPEREADILFCSGVSSCLLHTAAFPFHSVLILAVFLGCRRSSVVVVVESGMKMDKSLSFCFSFCNGGSNDYFDVPLLWGKAPAPIFGEMFWWFSDLFLCCYCLLFVFFAFS